MSSGSRYLNRAVRELTRLQSRLRPQNAAVVDDILDTLDDAADAFTREGSNFNMNEAVFKEQARQQRNREFQDAFRMGFNGYR